MPRDPLKQLLESADATAAAPPTLADLSQRVKRRHHRRRTMKTAGVAIAAIVMIAVPLLTLAMFPRHSSPPTNFVMKNRPPAPTRQDLARLDLIAELHEQTADRLQRATSSTQVQPVPVIVADHDIVLKQVREQRDRAALILIYDADQAAREKQTTRALAAYRRTIELFPQTHWAAVARQRLKEMPT